MRTFILIIVLLVTLSLLNGLTTGRSLPLADSYMMRARGVEAIYWNPANIHDNSVNFWVPGTNISIYIANNSFDIETYNRISGKYLTDRMKQDVLDQIDRRITITGEGHVGVFATTINNVGLASSISTYNRLSISKKYLQLIFFGNAEDSYTFHDADNNLSSISFMDFTLAYGDIRVSDLFDDMPPIRLGVSGSLLAGIHHIQSRDYRSSLTTGLDGLAFEQDFKLRSGLAGAGFKSMIGIATDPFPNFHAGITLDNLFGFINWGLVAEDRSFSFTADSIYVANIDQDLYSESIVTQSIGSYTTPLAPELRVGVMYNLNDIELSADWIQGTGKSVVTENKGRVAIGAQLHAAKHVPFQIGLAFGNRDYPWRISYGLGLKTRFGEFGLGFQSFKSILPGTKSQGLALSSYLSIRI